MRAGSVAVGRRGGRRRGLKVGLLGLLAIVLATGAALAVYAWRSLPQTDGAITLTASGAVPRGAVTIERDAAGIPTIRAASRDDALFGLGYAHAQDRLWQMEFQRRVGMGRLSEIFGPASLNTDRFLRTLGTGRAARSAWDFLPEETKTALNAYVAAEEPWQIAKDPDRAADLDAVLYRLAEGLRVVSILLHPWIPDATDKLLAALGEERREIAAAKFGDWGGGHVRKIDPLFPRVDG